MNRESIYQNLEKLNPAELIALDEIVKEYLSAKKKHPKWPKDIIHAAAIVAEESGELIRAALMEHYEDETKESVYREAIQTGAMALRFFLNTYLVESEQVAAS